MFPLFSCHPLRDTDMKTEAQRETQRYRAVQTEIKDRDIETVTVVVLAVVEVKLKQFITSPTDKDNIENYDDLQNTDNMTNEDK